MLLADWPPLRTDIVGLFRLGCESHEPAEALWHSDWLSLYLRLIEQ